MYEIYFVFASRMHGDELSVGHAPIRVWYQARFCNISVVYPTGRPCELVVALAP